MNEHAISWFAIPITDLERARTFYSTLLGFGYIAMILDTEGNRIGLYSPN